MAGYQQTISVDILNLDSKVIRFAVNNIDL